MGPVGLVILFGSGEISSSGRRIYDWLFQGMREPVEVAVLETPAGFQPNSASVAGQVAEFLEDHLQNYAPQVAVVPACKRGTPCSPDNPEILAPLKTANVVFLGPGSPSYAVRQLRDSWAWEAILARHQMGAHLILSSAATVATSAYALPVYEIFKVGEDLFWLEGLDLFGAYGLPMVFIPHWDNLEGGSTLDTSRCFMGCERFEALLDLLPDRDLVIAGIDEHTALVVDLGQGRLEVRGRGGVTFLRGGEARRCTAGSCLTVADLGRVQTDWPGAGISPQVREWIEEAGQPHEGLRSEEPDAEVLALVEERERAREQRDWCSADVLRMKIAELGWRVQDTPEGAILERS